MDERGKALFALGMTCMAGLMIAALGLHWLITPAAGAATPTSVALTWLQVIVGLGVAHSTWRKAKRADRVL